LVHSRPCDAEEVAQLRGAVVAGSVKTDEVRLLAWSEVRSVATEAALGLDERSASDSATSAPGAPP
jgi:hypothetical protein